MSPNPILDASVVAFGKNRQWADDAIAQVDDECLKVPLHAETNSIAVIMKHVAGNLLSRWTNFLTEDGEKAWRDRDGEFVDTFASRDELLAYWNDGWQCLTATLATLTDADLTRTVHIRGEAMTAADALQRSLGHTCYHVGQIIMVARCVCQGEWKTLTIPRGASKEHNSAVWGSEQYRAKP